MDELENLDWNEILERLAHYATSAAGKESLIGLAPLDGASEAESSFLKTIEAQSVLSKGERPFMESLDFCPTWHQRLKKSAVLKTLELKDVRRHCLEIIALSEVIREFESPWVSGIKQRLMDATHPLSAIDQLMTPQGEIRTDASEKLYSLYGERNQLTREIQSGLDKLVKQHDLEGVLQDRYVTNREGRWVLPIKSGMRHNFEGIIHASSASKQTVFMEPEQIIPLNNRMRQVDAEIEAEIERLLTELSQYLEAQMSDFEESQKVMLECDIRFAMAQLAMALNASPVRFSEEVIQLKNVRHPLLVFNNENVVPNTIQLNQVQRILLLSGPNAGGKTVLLKAVGLAAQMARCGLLVCADADSELPFFRRLYIAVGDAQSVDAHLSTFAAHIQILNEATKAQGFEYLLLIDEICGSTDPEEGSALGRAFIEIYSENQVFGVITSHLGPLKLGWESDSGVVNGSMEYSMKTGRSTYQFIPGVPGQSLALTTAEKVGVPAKILDRALHFMSPQSKAQQTAMKELEKMRNEISGARLELRAQQEQANKKQQEYEKKLLEFERDKDAKLHKMVQQAQRDIDQMIEKARVEDIFKRHERLEKTKQELPQVVKSPESTTQAQTIDSLEAFEKAFPPGSQVYVASLSRDGVVQGQSNAKGEIPVLANSMRLMVPWQQLQPPRSAPNPTQNIVRRSAGVQVTFNESQRVIDLRGKSVDDAISQLEIELDQASIHNEDRVRIVHGHGTEVLKRAVRAYLSRSLYVKKWMAGAPESGGDGTTWAEIQPTS